MSKSIVGVHSTWYPFFLPRSKLFPRAGNPFIQDETLEDMEGDYLTSVEISYAGHVTDSLVMSLYTVMKVVVIQFVYSNQT